MSGLDPEQRLRFRELLSAAFPATPMVLLATHQVEDVTAVCSAVVVHGWLARVQILRQPSAELAAVA